MSENAAETAASISKESLSDRATLDLFVTVLGFGLCRAWIVFCFGAPLVMQTTESSAHWVYLVLGALSALGIGLVVGKHGAREQSVSQAMYVLTPLMLAVSGVILPVSLSIHHEVAMIFGLITGGVAAGALQVLWGSHFACNGLYFAELASPGAAIVTALVIALSAGTTNFLGFAVIPLVSFGLLVYVSLRTHRDRSHGGEGVVLSDAPSQAHAQGHGLSQAAGQAQGQTQEQTQEQQLASGWLTKLHGGLACLAKPIDTHSEEPSDSNELGLAKLAISTLVFTALCRLFDAIPQQEDPFAFIGGSTIFALIVVGVAFIAIVMRWKQRFNPIFTYRLSLPIMVTGFAAIALFADSHASLSLLLINIGYEFFDVLVWVLFTAVSLRPGKNSVHVYGFGVAAMFAGMALGNELGVLLDTMVKQGDVQMTVVAMGCTLCLVMVAFLVLPEGTLVSFTEGVRAKNRDQSDEMPAQQSEAASNTVEAASQSGEEELVATTRMDRLEQQCALVAVRYSLTPREQEVLILLSYGRTLSIIARDLYIAKGTARTHIENIYRKLDVHKQQELIDLVEHYEG